MKIARGYDDLARGVAGKLSMARITLTEQDVAQLLADPSGAARADTAVKIAAGFNSGSLTDQERQLAEEIFRLMVQDAEVRVREAMAQNLKENPNVPRDVAVSLAKDVASVALPVLRFSEALSDDDLIELVRGQDAEKQVAIAQRSTVSESVSEALVETRNEDAVTTLVSNEGADISEKSLHKVVGDLGDREGIQSAMVRRPKLPVTVSERLVTMISEGMKEELVKLQELPPSLATDLILQSRERATITLSSGSSADELASLVRQLNDNGRLTPSIILRGLCMGDINFFEAAFAELLGISIINARKLIHDPGKLGLKVAFEKAGLPNSHFPAARAAIDVAQETDYDGGENDRERYARRMIERILTQYGELGVEFDSDDLEYLLTKMGQLSADPLTAS